jgi:beta-N-acetylhexosaminidase
MIPALDPDRPASLSPAVVKLLREDLRFRGLILTDDLEMGAIRGARPAEESALMALEAGVDILMFSAPATALRVKQAIQAALSSGRLEAARVDEACLRILRAKLALGIQGEADPRIRAEEFAAFGEAAAKTAKFIRLARGRADTEEGKAAK